MWKGEKNKFFLLNIEKRNGKTKNENKTSTSTREIKSIKMFLQQPIHNFYGFPMKSHLNLSIKNIISQCKSTTPQKVELEVP